METVAGGRSVAMKGNCESGTFEITPSHTYPSQSTNRQLITEKLRFLNLME